MYEKSVPEASFLKASSRLRGEFAPTWRVRAYASFKKTGLRRQLSA
jgi:hypothetical protein